MEQLAHGYGLVEGPVWIPNRGLAFSDVHGGGVYCLHSLGEVSTLFPHRRGIGGMAARSRIAPLRPDAAVPLKSRTGSAA